MKKWKTAVVLTAFFSLLLPGTAFARERIEEISLNFSADMGSEDPWPSVEITPENDGYMIEDFQFLSDSSEKYPQGTVTLLADDDYYFGTIKRTDCTLEGEGASFVKAVKDSSRKLRLTVSFREMGDGEVSAPSSLFWSESGTVSWEPVPGARSYQLRLMHNGKAVSTETFETKESSYSFASQITQTGTYSFRIRSVSRYNSSVYSDWITSPGFQVNEATLELIRSIAGNPSGENASANGNDGAVSLTPGQWQWFSSQNAWYWQNPDGTYAYQQWIHTSDGWYYTGSDGHMASGWQWIKGSDGLSRCYYFGTGDGNAQGRMYAGTTTPDNYTVNGDGAWTVDGKVQVQ